MFGLRWADAHAHQFSLPFKAEIKMHHAHADTDTNELKHLKAPHASLPLAVITTEDGDELETRPCKPDLDVPKCPPPNAHYFWSAWGPWGDCKGWQGKSCGARGKRTRTKVCLSTRPNASGGEKKCPGDASASEQCEGHCYEGELNCIIDGTQPLTTRSGIDVEFGRRMFFVPNRGL